MKVLGVVTLSVYYLHDIGTIIFKDKYSVKRAENNLETGSGG
jgi:hypothetical protein